MSLAVIPARGGSKRIPRKNIREFCGKPMIAWPILAAIESGCFDRIIVSTDDEEIAEVAERYGAEVPFRRPRKLADDYAGTVPVIAHAVEWLNTEGIATDAVCCLYATAPFVQAKDLRAGLERLKAEGCEYTFSVTSYAFPVQRALRVLDSGRVSMFYPENANTRSQDLEEAYHDAGQFYWGRSSAWLSRQPILASSSTPVFLPRERVQDIDTLEDWRRAEWLFREMHAGHSGGL